MPLLLIADLIADRVVEKLGARAMYTSLALPPDAPSRRRFNAIAKTIPGAVKRGQIWIVTREAWNAARDAQVRP